MKKLITFSLWGDNPFYTEGACRNAELAQEIYPDWICRFYIAGRNTPQKVIDRLEAYPNTEVVVIDEEGTPNSTMWRFTACDDEDVECFISRDTDSRLSLREKEAVDEWMESDKKFHIMRDHPYHTAAVMAGMWGMKRGGIFGMKNKIENFIRGGYHADKKGADQAFLWGLVWPLAMNDNLTHDPFYTENAAFPTPERDANALVYFIGEAVREDDTLWSQADRDVLDRRENAS